MYFHMRVRSFQNQTKASFVLTVFWMLLFGLLPMSIDMSRMESDANCPFGGHSVSMCQMNPMEHIQEWQSMFTMLPVKSVLTLLFAILALIAIRTLKLRIKVPLPELPSLLFKNHSVRTNNFRRRSFLIDVFSRGILHPKLF